MYLKLDAYFLTFTSFSVYRNQRWSVTLLSNFVVLCFVFCYSYQWIIRLRKTTRSKKGKNVIQISKR